LDKVTKTFNDAKKDVQATEDIIEKISDKTEKEAETKETKL
jgi:uncharacterized protein involved in outer membrane biogenesis